MNKRECARLAKQKYGPHASAVNVSNKDRHQRFGVMIVTPKGAIGDSLLGCLGHGDSYQSAWGMAEKNEVAMKLATEWQNTKKDFEDFKNDPTGYLEKQKSIIAEKTKEENIALAGI